MFPFSLVTSMSAFCFLVVRLPCSLFSLINNRILVRYAHPSTTVLGGCCWLVVLGSTSVPLENCGLARHVADRRQDVVAGVGSHGTHLAGSRVPAFAGQILDPFSLLGILFLQTLEGLSGLLGHTVRRTTTHRLGTTLRLQPPQHRLPVCKRTTNIHRFPFFSCFLMGTRKKCVTGCKGIRRIATSVVWVQVLVLIKKPGFSTKNEMRHAVDVHFSQKGLPIRNHSVDIKQMIPSCRVRGPKDTPAVLSPIKKTMFFLSRFSRLT